MECPHCQYVKEEEVETALNTEYGNFFVIDTGDEMWRWDNAKKYSETATMVGCPRCRKMFIDFVLFNLKK